MDGIEVSRGIKERKLRTRLIFMTGHDEFSFAYQAIKLGIDDYLMQNYARKSLNLAVIEKELGLESSYLRRVYKLTAGITMMQKLEEIRIGKAKQYLNSGKYQSQEISEMVGSSDPYYFSRRFKKICGVTPSEYRNTNVK